MERTTIPQGTLRFALEALDAQRANIAIHGPKQQAYYNGMRNMLDIILTDAFTEMCFVECDAAGHHTVPSKANPA